MSDNNAIAMGQVDLDDMIDHPELYGFLWTFGVLHKTEDKRKYVVCERAPYIEHMDDDVMRRHFGQNYFLAMANGTSGRVRDQEVVRSACEDDIRIRSDVRALQALVLRRALGTRASRRPTTIVVETVKVVEKFYDINGVAHSTLIEAQAASKAAIVDMQLNNA